MKRISDFVKSIGLKCDEALNVVANKAETLDESLERRKHIRDLQEEYSDIVIYIANELLESEDEVIKALPQNLQEAVTKLKSVVCEIEAISLKKLEEKGIKLCKECQEEINVVDAFCPWCGTKQ